MTLDLSKMDKILSVHQEDFDAEVEAGVSRQGLNAYLRDTGLMFPIGTIQKIYHIRFSYIMYGTHFDLGT